MARPVPRRPLGPRQGPGHRPQPGRRTAHGARSGGASPRAVERAPLDPHQQRVAGLRGPQAHRQEQPSVLSVRGDDQPRGAPVRGRGRGPRVLHLREVRRRHPPPARIARLAGIRPEDGASAGAPLPDERSDHLRYPGGPRRAARRRRSPAGAPHPRRLQRRGLRCGRIRSHRPGRTRHHRSRAAQVELGPAARRASLRRVLRHRRHHLHLRRSRDRRAGEGARHGLAPDAGALHLRRDGRRALSLQLPGRDRARVGGGVRPHRGADGGAGPGAEVDIPAARNHVVPVRRKTAPAGHGIMFPSRGCAPSPSEAP